MLAAGENSTQPVYLLSYTPKRSDRTPAPVRYAYDKSTRGRAWLEARVDHFGSYPLPALLRPMTISRWSSNAISYKPISVITPPFPMTPHRHIRRRRRHTTTMPTRRPPSIPARPDVDTADLSAQCILPVRRTTISITVILLQGYFRRYVRRSATISRSRIVEAVTVVLLLCVWVWDRVEVIMLPKRFRIGTPTRCAALLRKPITAAGRRCWLG